MPAETTPFVGKGTTLGYNTATGTAVTTATSYTTAAYVTSVSPNYSTGEAENVYLASTFKDYLPTIPEGTMDFNAKYVPGDAGTAEFVALSNNAQTCHWCIKTLAGSMIQFDGFVKDFKVNFENESVVECEGSMRIRTMPVYTPAT